MADLFISYASQDRETVRLLVDQFEQQGWSVWWDRYIEVGTSFDRSIEDAIDASRCIVVVWSRHSVNSDWVRAEAAEGLERDILIPVMLENVRPPLLFRQKQAINLVDWTGDAEHLGELVPSIAAILKSYEDSSLPVSTQTSWLLGPTKAESPEIESLAAATDAVLDLAFSYYDHLFIYPKSYVKEQLAGAQLDSLVKEEGLTGYVHGTISRGSSGALVFTLCIEKTGAPLLERIVEITETASLPKLIGQCLLDCAPEMQGSVPAEADTLMQFLSMRNVEALSHYAASFRFAEANDYNGTLEVCDKALALDPGFSKLFSGKATAYQYLGRRAQSREAAALAVSNSQHESRRNLLKARGTYYAMYTEDFEKAVKEFEAEVELSPLDVSAINNLAVSHFYLLNFDRARELSQRDLSLYPEKKIGHQNAAYYALYAGAFGEAERIASKLFDKDANYHSSNVARALAAAARGDIETAKDAYEQGRRFSDRSDALFLQGLADLAMAAAMNETARDHLSEGLKLDRQLRDDEHAARKLLMLAELAEPGSDEVQGYIADAITVSVTTATLATALAIAAMSPDTDVSKIETNLKERIDTHSRAFAKTATAIRRFDAGEVGEAFQLLEEAISIIDLWLIRFIRALLFNRAGLHLEAADERAICVRRAGEGLAAALDEQPTYRFLKKMQD